MRAGERRLLAGAALAVALGVGSVALVQGGGDEPAGGTATTSAGAAASSPAPTPGDSDPSAAASTPAAGSPATAAPVEPTPGASTSAPSARGPNGVSEVIIQPPRATSTVPGATGPGSLADEPVVELVDLTGLPARATSVKGVLDGWPQQVLPVVAFSRVRSTSVAPGGEVLQLGLDAVTTVSPDAVLRRYRAAMAEHGFAEQPSTDPNTGTTIAFARGADAVSITVGQVARGTSYAVHAVLHPAGG